MSVPPTAAQVDSISGPLRTASAELYSRICNSPDTMFGLNSMAELYDTSDAEKDPFDFQMESFAKGMSMAGQLWSRVAWTFAKPPWSILTACGPAVSDETLESVREVPSCCLDPGCMRPILEQDCVASVGKWDMRWAGMGLPRSVCSSDPPVAELRPGGMAAGGRGLRALRGESGADGEPDFCTPSMAPGTRPSPAQLGSHEFPSQGEQHV